MNLWSGSGEFNPCYIDEVHVRLCVNIQKNKWRSSLRCSSEHLWTKEGLRIVLVVQTECNVNKNVYHKYKNRESNEMNLPGWDARYRSDWRNGKGEGMLEQLMAGFIISSASKLPETLDIWNRWGVLSIDLRSWKIKLFNFVRIWSMTHASRAHKLRCMVWPLAQLPPDIR